MIVRNEERFLADALTSVQASLMKFASSIRDRPTEPSRSPNRSCPRQPSGLA